MKRNTYYRGEKEAQSISAGGRQRPEMCPWPEEVVFWHITMLEPFILSPRLWAPWGEARPVTPPTEPCPQRAELGISRCAS